MPPLFAIALGVPGFNKINASDLILFKIFLIVKIISCESQSSQIGQLSFFRSRLQLGAIVWREYQPFITIVLRVSNAILSPQTSQSSNNPSLPAAAQLVSIRPLRLSARRPKQTKQWPHQHLQPHHHWSFSQLAAQPTSSPSR